MGSGRWSARWPLPVALRRELKARRLLGEASRELCVEFGVSRQMLSRIMNDEAVEPFEVCRGRGQLSADDREVISRGLVEGLSQAEIARRLGCHRSTVSRELARNGGSEKYRAVVAERAACQRAKRPKVFKLAGNMVLAGVVERCRRGCGRRCRSVRGCESSSLTMRRCVCLQKRSIERSMCMGVAV